MKKEKRTIGVEEQMGSLLIYSTNLSAGRFVEVAVIHQGVLCWRRVAEILRAWIYQQKLPAPVPLS